MYLVINIFGDGEIQYGDWGGAIHLTRCYMLCTGL